MQHGEEIKRKENIMNREEKLEIIADILELEVNELSDDMLLEGIETWDSVAVLSVISIINEKFNRYPLAEEIKRYKTIGDLQNAMQ